MARIKTADPRDGSGDSAWTWVPVPRPCDWIGWVAGKTVWIEGHHVGRTVPCNEWFTDGQLPCRYDHTEHRLNQSGYFPFFHSSGKRYFISVAEYSRPAIDKLPLWVEVRILCGKGRYDPVTITPTGPGRVWARKHLEPREGHHIDDALLVLWKDRELARWCRANPISAVETPKVEEPKAAAAERWHPDPETHEDIRDIFRPPTPPTAADTLGEVFRKRGIKHPPGANGKPV